MIKQLLKVILIIALIILMLKVILPTNTVNAPKIAQADTVATSTNETSSKEEETGGDDEDDPDRVEPYWRDHAKAITEAIAIKETGGTLDCSVTGLSGEKGCHQFLPSTWVSYSLEVFGYVAEQTPENAELVTLTKVEKWLEAGIDARGIFLIWNTGRNAGCSAGINRYGVPYDSCAYVEDAMRILDEVTHRNTLYSH